MQSYLFLFSVPSLSHLFSNPSAGKAWGLAPSVTNIATIIINWSSPRSLHPVLPFSSPPLSASPLPSTLPLLIPSPWSLLPAGGTWDYIRQDAPRGATDLLQGEYGFVSKLKGFVTCGYWIYSTISLWIYWFNTYFKWWSFDDSGIQSQVVRSVSKQIYVIPLRGFGGFVRSDTLDLLGPVGYLLATDQGSTAPAGSLTGAVWGPFSFSIYMRQIYGQFQVSIGD